MGSVMVNTALVTQAEKDWAARVAATGNAQQKRELATSHAAFVTQQEEDKPLYEEIAEKDQEAKDALKEQQEEAAEKVAEQNEAAQEKYEGELDAYHDAQEAASE